MPKDSGWDIGLPRFGENRTKAKKKKKNVLPFPTVPDKIHLGLKKITLPTQRMFCPSGGLFVLFCPSSLVDTPHPESDRGKVEPRNSGQSPPSKPSVTDRCDSGQPAQLLGPRGRRASANQLPPDRVKLCGRTPFFTN